MDVTFAHTPAFVGSHVTGYDNALKGILEHFWNGKAGTAPKLERKPNGKINFIGGHGQEVVACNHPIGVGATDEFLMTLSRIAGKPIAKALEQERGRLLDAMADSSAHIHGKKFAIYGDPDLCYGLAAFLLELGAEPTH